LHDSRRLRTPKEFVLEGHMSNVTFPETVRCRSSIVTIYHVLNRGKDHFTLSYYDANGKRQRRMFRDYDRVFHFVLANSQNSVTLWNYEYLRRFR
jgi:hypothetical protein